MVVGIFLKDRQMENVLAQLVQQIPFNYTKIITNYPIRRLQIHYPKTLGIIKEFGILF